MSAALQSITLSDGRVFSIGDVVRYQLQSPTWLRPIGPGCVRQIYIAPNYANNDDAKYTLGVEFDWRRSGRLWMASACLMERLPPETITLYRLAEFGPDDA